jgi:hypothetical protein
MLALTEFSWKREDHTSLAEKRDFLELLQGSYPAIIIVTSCEYKTESIQLPHWNPLSTNDRLIFGVQLGPLSVDRKVFPALEAQKKLLVIRPGDFPVGASEMFIGQSEERVPPTAPCTRRSPRSSRQELRGSGMLNSADLSSIFHEHLQSLKR